MALADPRRYKQIQVYAPLELSARLKVEAKKQRRSVNNLIVVLLMRVFHIEEPRAEAENAS